MKFKELAIGDFFGFEEDELEEKYLKTSDRKYEDMRGVEYKVVTINSEVYMIPDAYFC